MRRSDSSASFPPRFVVLRLEVPSLHGSFAPVRSACDCGGPGLFGSRRPPGSRGGEVEVSQVPWGSRCVRALLLDPGGTSTSDPCDVVVWPSGWMTPSAPATSFLSGLDRRAHPLAVYASQEGSPPRHARLASGGWSTLAGQEWLPAGSLREFPVRSWRSPSPRLAWRNTRRTTSPSCTDPAPPAPRDTRAAARCAPGTRAPSAPPAAS